MYIGWGRSFIVLLDSDKEGKLQRDRYNEVFGPVVAEKIFCLEDIDPTWKKREIEKLFTETDRLLLLQTAYPSDTVYKKAHFNRAIQEAYLTNKRVTVSRDTQENIQKILDFCNSKFV